MLVTIQSIALCLILILSNSNFIKGLDWEQTLDLFRQQSQFCSLDFKEDERSGVYLTEMLSGYDYPAYIRKYGRIPYTGFKILKFFDWQFSGKKEHIKFKKQMRVIYCNYGRLQMNKIIDIPKDINWEIPICDYIPSERLFRKPRTYQKLVEIFRRPTLSSSKALAYAHPENFHCFKIARKKKYAVNANLNFFPGTWVGAWFYYNLTNSEKRELLNSHMSSNLEFFEDIDKFIIQKERVVPLAPLVSDTMKNEWNEWFYPFPNITFRRNLPYLYTLPYFFTFEELREWSENNEPLFLKFWKGNFSKPISDYMLEKTIEQTSIQNISIHMYDVKFFNMWKEKEKINWCELVSFDERYNYTAEDIDRVTLLFEQATSKFKILREPTKENYIKVLNNKLTKLRLLLPTFNQTINGSIHAVEQLMWNELKFHDQLLEALSNFPSYFQDIKRAWLKWDI